jgi:hypothetical protein
MADYGTWRRERWHFLSFYFACAQIEQPAACREALIGFLEDCNFQT